MTEFYLRYVNHERAEAYEALGWTIVSRSGGLASHGHWSCLMKWPHDTPPLEPTTPTASGIPSVTKGWRCMKTTDWDRVVTSAPLNKDAALARDGKGTSWTPARQFTNVFETPPLMRKYTDVAHNDLTGRRFQKFVVLGLRQEGSGWVCRCDCGRYSIQHKGGLLKQQSLGRAYCGECDYVEEMKAKRLPGKDEAEAARIRKEERKALDAERDARVHLALKKIMRGEIASGETADDFLRSVVNFTRVELAELRQSKAT